MHGRRYQIRWNPIAVRVENEKVSRPLIGFPFLIVVASPAETRSSFAGAMCHSGHVIAVGRRASNMLQVVTGRSNVASRSATRGAVRSRHAGGRGRTVV